MHEPLEMVGGEGLGMTITGNLVKKWTNTTYLAVSKICISNKYAHYYVCTTTSTVPVLDVRWFHFFEIL